jgi:glycosyltransferase involved in cell wall biosynthesis
LPRQRRAVERAAGVIAPSRVFARHLVRDYGAPPERIAVAPNPVALESFAPRDADGSTTRAWRLVFVGRISVRKGIDQLVELSHRLDDLAGRIELAIVGGATLWSDYRALLDDLNPRVGRYEGVASHDHVRTILESADGLVQPSTYEPFAITVAEALASGVPVVASEEVGAAEDVDVGCCAVVPTGQIHALEAAVRRLVNRLDDGERASLAHSARREAERLFSPERAARLVADALEVAVRRGPAPYSVR